MRRLFLWIALLPRNLIVALIIIYRKVVSPTYGQVCRYHPSCSQYALGAVQNRGAFLGTGFSVLRIIRCNPWSSGGIDDPPVSRSSSYELGAIGFVKVKER